MITYVVCDLFTSPARTLVNTVNTVGVMGKGIAKDFKTIYPEMFARYQKLCEKGLFNIGQLWLYRTPNKWVLNFPTKEHWKNPSHPSYIEAGLQKFASTYHLHSITSVSFPMLGCGNGALDWETQVQPLMKKYLGKLPIDVYIHLQDRPDTYTPEHRNIREIKKWLRGEPESMAFSEVWADLIATIVSDAHNASISYAKEYQEQVANDGCAIAVRHGSETVTIDNQAFRDLWQQLRTSGFISHNNLPSGLNTYSDRVVPLMAKLPYIRLVEMADETNHKSHTVGLRIVPSQRSDNGSDLPLLSSIGAVEPE